MMQQIFRTKLIQYIEAYTTDFNTYHAFPLIFTINQRNSKSKD